MNPSPAMADSSESSVWGNPEDWVLGRDIVPGFAFFGGISIQENAGGVSSRAPGVDPNQIATLSPNRNQPYFDNTTRTGWNPLTVGRFEGGSRSVFPHMGASIEMAVPRLSFLGLVPFVHGDISLSFDVDHTAASEGDPDEEPLIPVLETGVQPSLNSVSGIGSKVFGKVEPLVYSAGAGVSFGFSFAGRKLWIKPSFEYRYDEVTASYLVSGAVAGERRNVREVTPPFRVRLAPVCPCIASVASASETRGFHSLGPGLELEFEAARAGRLRLSLFLSGQAYRIMGGREIDVRGGTPFDLYNSDQTTDPYVQVPGPNALDPDSPAVETPTLDGTADYERDPWSYRANVGLRFRWDPE